MKLSDFDFDLPPDRIALRPATPRDTSRLLSINGGQLSDHFVSDLPSLLRDGDVIVMNDTKVMRAQLSGTREARQADGDPVKVDATLLEPEGHNRWWAFARPGKRLRVGDQITFGETLAACIAEKSNDGRVLLEFKSGDRALEVAIEAHGVMPLPPYIAGRRPADAQDDKDYQTVYASRRGAVAAPTAGLHISHELLEQLKTRGHELLYVTLHVGAGTFLPVKTDNVDEHKMHAEWGEVSPQVADAIRAARGEGRRILSVGTTTLRILETAARDQGEVRGFTGETDIFIKPGFVFKAVDMLMTNFHLPRSTLLMLVHAFGGGDAMRCAYQHALKNDYRFFSYGDASLIFRGTAS